LKIFESLEVADRVGRKNVIVETGAHIFTLYIGQIFEFLNIQYLRTEFVLTKVEMAFFFTFMSSCPEMSFLGQKREKFPK
jgi:hypothetical protein